MSSRFEQGIQLMQLRQPAKAAEAFRHVLTEDPQHAPSLSRLSLCLRAQGDTAGALTAAGQAVGLQPEDDFNHYALALAQLADGQTARAEASLREALRLDPSDPDYYCLLSAMLAERTDWGAALKQAEDGLRSNPVHLGCLNARALALWRLGRRDEADKVLDQVLSLDPEDELAFERKGWIRLDLGDSAAAERFFAESLRLDPDDETAKDGLLSAIKARSKVYGLFLKVAFQAARLSPNARIGAAIGGWLLYRFILKTVRAQPELGLYLWPLIGAYVAFILLLLLAEPLANLALLRSPLGRLALSGPQQREAKAVGALVALLLLALASYPWAGMNGVFFAILCFGQCFVAREYFKFEPEQRGPGLKALGAASVLGIALVLLSRLPALPQDMGSQLFLWGLALFFPSMLVAQWYEFKPRSSR